MAVSTFVSEKWGRKLAFWLMWLDSRDGESGNARISSIYSGREFGTGYRETGQVDVSAECMDTHTLMVRMQIEHRALYDALVEWAKDDGTRGEQASRLSCHRDTYRDRVEGGLSTLETWDRERRLKSKSRLPSPQKA